jgi:hypothetical protein
MEKVNERKFCQSTPKCRTRVGQHEKILIKITYVLDGDSESTCEFCITIAVQFVTSLQANELRLHFFARKETKEIIHNCCTSNFDVRF